MENYMKSTKVRPLRPPPYYPRLFLPTTRADVELSNYGQQIPRSVNDNPDELRPISNSRSCTGSICQSFSTATNEKFVVLKLRTR